MAVVFLIGRRTDESYFAGFKIWLEHIRGIHSSIAYGSCPYQRMYLVDIHNVIVAFSLHAIHYLLDALLKVTTILGACKQSAHVQLIYLASLQPLGHLVFLDESGQSPYKGSLAHARFTHMQWVVLVATTEHLDGAFQFMLSSDKRIMHLIIVVHASHELLPRGFR